MEEKGNHWMQRALLALCCCVIQVLTLPITDGIDGKAIWQDEGGVENEGGEGWEAWVGSQEYLLGAAVLLTSITLLLACVCCKKTAAGFKRSDSALQELGSVTSRSSGGMEGGRGGEEFTMFPPPGIAGLSASTTQINFEPLPDIRPRGPGGAAKEKQGITEKTLPASFPSVVANNMSAQAEHWFAEPHKNFPRSQLQYVREIGRGWFGRVLEGRATGINHELHVAKAPPIRVAVKVLREDATPTEQMYFLHELRAYRDLTHPNILKVLAYCLETEPFLILLQLCTMGDLKALVRQDKTLKEAVLLRMVQNVAAGLAHMHQHAFIHTDLAARNCVVDEDLTVKIGDYGCNIDYYKDEYYCALDVALPLRWCAPETLKCTDTTIETKEVTFAANVWSFGIIVWEVLSRGQLPYPDMTDDEVIQHVVIEKAYVMERQRDFTLHADKMHNIMNLCWESESSRPDMANLHSLLSHLCDHLEPEDSELRSFESRWNQLQPPPRDHSIVHLTNTSDLRFDSDFSLSTSGGRYLGGAMSPSLQNLRGSVEDLDAKIAARFGSALPSWLGMEPGQPMDSLTQEITDAIQCLDEALADEKSEPSSSTHTSPEKSLPNFRVGSYVSHPPQSAVSSATVEHSSLKGALSEGEDEGFSLRLEQGEFSEMVRIKSQSVQDFMKLTVVEDESSDSDNASQRNSLGFDPSKPLVSEKTFSSEGNLHEAVRDAAFLVEIEKLQAEHKFSIISEASRENPSSIEYRNLDFALGKREESSQVFPSLGRDSESDDGETESSKRPFLVEDTSSSRQEESSHKALENKPEIKKIEKLHQRTLLRPTPASPDCVVSSREVKSAALPDIVVHDASSKQSSISSSPSPVQVAEEQPKQFNFVVKKDKDSGKSSDSVFSGNLVSAVQSNLENEVSLSSKCKQEVSESDLSEGGELCKTINSTQFIEQAQERSRKRLTSTPCHNNTRRNLRQDSSDISLCTSHQEHGKGANEVSYEGDGACASISGLEKVGIMRKLSFEPDVDCKKSEEVAKDRVHKRSDKDVSFKPEEVVEGEEIVIGALEDYSLDLYKGLKSSTSDARTTDSLEVSKATKGSEVKVSAIPEYDLEQWDQFLGNALNRNKYESTDIVFPEGGGAVMVASKATSTDSLGSSFEFDKFIFANTSVKSKFSEPIENISEDRTEEHERNLKLLEISNAFHHSTCEEIAVILDKVDASTLCNLSYERPDLNTDNFFKSDSSLPPDVESPDTDGDSESSKLPHERIFRVLKPSWDDDGSDCSEAKGSGTKTLNTKSASETSGKASPSDLSCSSVSPCKTDDSEGKCDRMYKREILKSQDSLSDTSSPTGTYYRASSVDSSYDAGVPKETKSKEGDETSKIDLERTFEVIKSGRNYPSEPEVQSSALILEVPGKPGIPLGAKSLSSESDCGIGSDLASCKSGSGCSEGSSGCPLANLGVTKPKDPEDEESDLSPVYPSRGKDECWSSQESQDSAVENDDSENGDFFLLQQMEAWKHAADQTRELLQQAASGSAFTVPNKKTSTRVEHAEEVIEVGSAGSSPKSVYSSTDLLNLDDEGTYVSYNTTDDEEIVGYKPEDINALRAELSLKLGNAQGPAVREEEEDEEEITDALEDRDNVVINYRGIVATTLSPIKEESFIGEFESPTKASKHGANNSADFSHNSSTEFQEPEDGEVKNVADHDINEAINEALFDMDDEAMSIEEKTISENVETVALAPEVKAGNIEVGENTSEKALEKNVQNEVDLPKLEDKMDDSLIVEDLEEDSGPSSITVYSGRMEGDDDVLVVDTQTFEAKLIDGGKPRSHLAFISQEKETENMAEPPGAEVEDLLFGSDDVAPESIPSVGIGGSRFDEMRHREQFLSNNPSWGKKEIETKDYDGDMESKPVTAVGGKTEDPGNKKELGTEEQKVEASPQGIQVPQYHPYFTSALSAISHPNASIEDKPRFEEVEHISLPYDVNYPMAGDDTQKSESKTEEAKEEQQKLGEKVEQHVKSVTVEEESKIKQEEMQKKDKEEEDHDEAPPVRLSFLGSLYSQDSSEGKKDGPKCDKSSDDVGRPKTPEPGETQHLTSAQFLALSTYQSSDHEEIEEHLEGPMNSGDDDSEGSEDEGNGRECKKPHMEDPRYTPDWESDSDSDGESSSTSGEFMWKPGEDYTDSKVVLDVIEEEDEVGDNSDASESGEEEFTPSTWNRNLTPSKSLLKSPESKSNERKSVHWKRQRHHRVYEYPPEPRSWQQSYSGENNRRTWGRSLDYTTFADWELGCDEFVADEGGDIDDLVFRNKPTRPAPPPPIYSLASVSFDDADGYYGDDGEFFIRSSGAPFTFTSSSFAAADFFAGIGGGRDYGRNAVVESDYNNLYFTHASHGDSNGDGAGHGNGEGKKEYDDCDGEGECEDKPLDYQIQYGDDYGNLYGDGAPVRKMEDCEETQSIDTPISETRESYTPDSSPPEGLGQLRHTRNKLRLELPSFGSNSKGITESGVQGPLWQDPYLCNGNADTYQESQKSKRLEVSEI
ncbi:uncharacterized protein LOC143032750 isoform X2 [Oratosquilla oratoria]|uniref:uncharacterized protein LOC143032750 isoform X2 n=1 Tax=Oratosquilla oratoria TaxID=337810 RepID=UPI003F7594BD